MTGEEVHHPVVNVVWDVQLRQLLKESVMPDGVKRFTKVESDDDDVVEWLVESRLVMVCKTDISAAVVEPAGRKAN